MAMIPTNGTEDDDVTALPQDGGTPLSPPQDIPPNTDSSSGVVDDTHPATDSAVDSDEAYQEGQGAATGVVEPNGDGAVPGVNPVPPVVEPETKPVEEGDDKGSGDGANGDDAYGSSSFNG